MPKSGGCVNIVKTPGLENYPETVMTNGIKVKVGNKANWSFFTYKVDNTDFSKSDLRILNYKG